MRRQEFIAGLGVAAVWPVVAGASRATAYGAADDDYENFIDPFLRRLKDAGYVEGRNVAIRYRPSRMFCATNTHLVLPLVQCSCQGSYRTFTPTSLA